MKTLPFRCLFALMTGLGVLSAQEIPYLSGRVNDYANSLSPQTKAELEALLKEHEQKTSNQVVVLTIQSLEGHSLEEYSIKVVESWKLGQKEKDNGVLLLVVRDDRKLRIEVGDGLEGVLTDAISSQIIRREIVPRFKNADYDGGVRAGVRAILATIDGTYTASGDEGGPGTNGFSSMGEKIMAMAIFTLIVGMFTAIALFQPGFTGWFLYFFLMPFWFLFPQAFLGTTIPFFVYLVSFPLLKRVLAKNPRFQEMSKRWHSAGAGGWGSGGWSSGGGGGGFSGGGGSFSGGGSSGSW